MRIISLSFLLLSLQGMAQFGPAIEVQTSLNIYANYTNGGYGTSFRVDDVDGDGAMDVLHIVWPGSIYWIRNSDGLGTFEAPAPVHISSNDKLLYDLADLDLDGDLDAVVYERIGEQHALHMIENMGNGTFGDPILISDGTGMGLPPSSLDEAVRQLLCADITGDGLPDVVYTVLGGVRWFVNIGSDTFSAVQSFDRGSSLSVTLRAGDINGDGNIDIITDSDLTSGELYAALNMNGDATFWDTLVLHTPYSNYYET